MITEDIMPILLFALFFVICSLEDYLLTDKRDSNDDSETNDKDESSIS